jgi:hypothetical protein
MACFRIQTALWPGLVGLLLATACGGSAESPAPSDSNDGDAAGDTTPSDTRETLGFGWCCGKPEDCSSKRCSGIGEGPLFCTRSCEAYPDDCPIGYHCEQSVDACIPGSLSYTCEY